MCKIISIGKCSIKILYLLALTISQIMSEFYQIFFERSRFIHPFFVIWMMFFGESLIFFLYLIQRALMKEEQSNSSKFEMIPGTKKIKIVLILVGLAMCDFSITICMRLFNSSEVNTYEIIFNALFFGFAIYLCIYMLKYQLYKHHYFGIGVYFIGLILYTLVNIFYYVEKPLTASTEQTCPVWIIIIAMIAVQFLSSTQECTEKYLMDKEYISPFVVISLEGISGFIIVSGLIPILSLIPCNPTYLICNEYVSASFKAIFKEIYERSNVIWIIIFLIISAFVLNSFRLLTNQHFSPLHINLSYTFTHFFMFFFQAFVYDVIKNPSPVKISLLIFANLIMLFGVLIFLEIIVLNFWNLNTNTKEQIERRKTMDYKEIIESTENIIIS